MYSSSDQNHLFFRILDFYILAVWSYHVTYVLQSESTHYGGLNVKELLARNRRDIWSLSDCNETRTYNHLVRKRTLNHLWSVWPVFMAVLSKEFFDIQATMECGFTLKRVSYMKRTHSHVHCRNKFSQNSSIIWPVRLNRWVFVYKLSGRVFGSRFNHYHILDL